ncbi:MAG: hypothetical protein QW196_01260 [Sulfolobales archaeon]
MSGKTTFTKEALRRLGSFYVIDVTTHGEYTDLAPVVEGTVSLSQFSVEELAKLYLIAMASVVGEEEKAAFTGVQLGALRRFSSKLSDLPALIEAISMAADLPEMTRQVLISKLSNFCESYDEYTCVPYKSLTKPLGLPPTPAVIHIDPRNPAVAAFVTHAVVINSSNAQRPSLRT